MKEAREDFETVIRLDPKLEMLVQKELNELEEQVKIKDAEDKEKLKNMFT